MTIHRITNRCQYKNCKNGKYNNSQLFYFPSQIERKKIWIENSGNSMLKHWKMSSVTSTGLCRDHFKQTDFIKGKRGIRLKRGSIPIHWKEALKNPIMVHSIEINDIIKLKNHPTMKVEPEDIIKPEDITEYDNIPSKCKCIEIIQEEYDIDEELLELNKDL